jgi:hypothetical protein
MDCFCYLSITACQKGLHKDIQTQQKLPGMGGLALCWPHFMILGDMNNVRRVCHLGSVL